MDATTFKQITDQITPDIVYFLPEIALSVTACVVLLLDLALKRERSRALAWVTLAGIVVAGWLLLWLEPFEGPGRALFRTAEVQDGAVTGAMTDFGMIWWDGFGNFFKLLLLGGAAGSVGLAYLYGPLHGARQGELLSVLLITTVGMFLMATASDALIFVLGVEMVSIPSFILVCYTKTNRASAEAALKYVVYGSVSSGMMIYGFSLLFGMTGTTQLAGIADHAAGVSIEYGFDWTLAFTVLLIVAGLAYKMSMVPFHFWTPDVYQGAPTPVTAFLATASKLAGFALFIRLLAGLDQAPAFTGFDWAVMVAVFSAVTMTVGNLGALMQSDVKRMLAYSSIAHAGYLLMGCTSLFGKVPGVEAIGFYGLAYLFMNLGAFAVLVAVENRTGRVDVDGFNGLGFRAPLLAAAMTTCLISLVGLPPTAGFIGKLQLFMVALEAKMTLLVVLAGLNTAISLFYYARILRAMYLVDTGDRTPLGESGALRAIAAVSMAVVLYLGVFFGGALSATQSMDFAPRPETKPVPAAPAEDQEASAVEQAREGERLAGQPDESGESR